MSSSRQCDLKDPEPVEIVQDEIEMEIVEETSDLHQGPANGRTYPSNLVEQSISTADDVTIYAKHSWTHIKTGNQYILHAIGIDQDSVIPSPTAIYSPVDGYGVHVRKWSEFEKKFKFNNA